MLTHNLSGAIIDSGAVAKIHLADEPRPARWTLCCLRHCPRRLCEALRHAQEYLSVSFWLSTIAPHERQKDLIVRFIDDGRTDRSAVVDRVGFDNIAAHTGSVGEDSCRSGSDDDGRCDTGTCVNRAQVADDDTCPAAGALAGRD